MYIRGDVETHQQDILRKAVTQTMPFKDETAGRGDLGSTEGVQAAAGGDDG